MRSSLAKWFRNFVIASWVYIEIKSITGWSKSKGPDQAAQLQRRLVRTIIQDLDKPNQNWVITQYVTYLTTAKFSRELFLRLIFSLLTIQICLLIYLLVFLGMRMMMLYSVSQFPIGWTSHPSQETFHFILVSILIPRNVLSIFSLVLARLSQWTFDNSLLSGSRCRISELFMGYNLHQYTTGHSYLCFCQTNRFSALSSL